MEIIMTNYELTQYIIHYIKKDKTKMAVMISGNWGTGKSYYIQHELIPELQKNDIADCFYWKDSRKNNY